MALAKAWLLLTIPGFVLALVLLAWTVRSLIRATRGAVVLSVPAVAEQQVDLPEAGALTLSIDRRFSSPNSAGLTLTLVSAANGHEIPLSRSILHTRSSSFSRSRVELYRFSIPAPGRYLLRTSGFSETDSADRIVFGRPFTTALVLHVLALIGLGVLVVGFLVTSGLILAKGNAGRAQVAAGGGKRTTGSLEGRVAEADAIVLCRTVMAGAIPRYEVVATWKGTLTPAMAALSAAGGLIVDTDRWQRSGYAPEEGQPVVLFLAMPRMEGATPASATLLEAIELVPVRSNHASFAFNDPARRRDITLEELERVVKR